MRYPVDEGGRSCTKVKCGHRHCKMADSEEERIRKKGVMKDIKYRVFLAVDSDNLGRKIVPVIIYAT